MTEIERALDSDRTAAEAWFPRLGYEPTMRTAIPAALMASPEIAVACPASAAVLRKHL